MSIVRVGTHLRWVECLNGCPGGRCFLLERNAWKYLMVWGDGVNQWWSTLMREGDYDVDFEQYCNFRITLMHLEDGVCGSRVPHAMRARWQQCAAQRLLRMPWTGNFSSVSTITCVLNFVRIQCLLLPYESLASDSRLPVNERRRIWLLFCVCMSSGGTRAFRINLHKLLALSLRVHKQGLSEGLL